MEHTSPTGCAHLFYRFLSERYVVGGEVSECIGIEQAVDVGTKGALPFVHHLQGMDMESGG